MDYIDIENIYYLGPDGSNATLAMKKFLSICNIKAKNQISQKTIKSVLESIENDFSSFAVLPIENSIEGIVRETIDNLLKIKDKDIKIQGELSIPIKHLLLSKNDKVNKIKKIYSHPQALAQCSDFLYKNLPDVELIDVSSTSYAAQKVSVSDSFDIAAIANESCADIFNLNILSDDINNEKDNTTRFFILGRKNLQKNNKGKTSIIVSTKNKPGALCKVLEIFYKHDINLTYLDSRPSKKRLGEYIFLIEIEGYNYEYKIKTALEELMIYTDFIKILGSFQIYLI